jgi:hypothetical protein
MAQPQVVHGSTFALIPSHSPLANLFTTDKPLAARCPAKAQRQPELSKAKFDVKYPVKRDSEIRKKRRHRILP